MQEPIQYVKRVSVALPLAAGLAGVFGGLAVNNAAQAANSVAQSTSQQANDIASASCHK
jgi:hypothetical protein